MAIPRGARHARASLRLSQRPRDPAGDRGRRQRTSHRPPDAASIGRLTRHLDFKQRETLGKLMLAVVAADGIVTDAEMTAVDFVPLRREITTDSESNGSGTVSVTMHDGSVVRLRKVAEDPADLPNFISFPSSSLSHVKSVPHWLHAI